MGLPIINLSLIPTFPARVFGSGPIVITKAGLNYTFSWDVSTYSYNPAPSGMARVLSYNPSTEATELIPVSEIAADWDSIVNKPATFPPSAHTHPISEVDGLQLALDAKVDDTDIGVTVQGYDADLSALAALSGTNNIYYRSGANTWSSVTIGTGLTFTGGTLAATASSGIIPRGYIFSLTLANNATDATNDIDVAAGEAASDDSSPVLMTLASLLTKRLDAAWAVGSGNGGRDTGSIADGTWHIWLIRRPDTGVVDALFSLSASAPTMPTNYTQKRRIGSVLRVSSALLAFTQYGDEFWLSSPPLDVNATNPGTSAVTRTLTTPAGIKARAFVNVQVSGQAAIANAAYLSALDATDLAASRTAAPLASSSFVNVANGGSGTVVFIWTNTSSQIRSRIEVSDGTTVLRVATLGWKDSR